LLPQKLALPASAANLKRLEKIRATLAKRTATERDEAQVLANTLAGVTVTLVRKAGENDQLFGSVTSADIAEALAAQGHKIDKRRIQLDEPIKLIGESMVNAKLHSDVTAQLKVVVTREPQA
jgi:large subunit ribosomal protein L9